MSKFIAQVSVAHVPSFKKYVASRTDMANLARALGLQELWPYGVHNNYYYTDKSGVVALLPNLILKSNLYRVDKFTCINYAFKVWLECADRYELNTWVPVIGSVPGVVGMKHAWTLILLGDESGIKQADCLYFEPNDGWAMGAELEAAYQAFPIGQLGYAGEKVFY